MTSEHGRTHDACPDVGPTVVVVSDAEEHPTDRPCEDCGGVVVVGQEPITAASEPELAAAGVWVTGSEWCSNLDCPSNHVLPGLTRVGVNDYICEVCNEALRTPIGLVFAHRRTH
jgi:hypothetical protein